MLGDFDSSYVPVYRTESLWATRLLSIYDGGIQVHQNNNSKTYQASLYARFWLEAGAQTEKHTVKILLQIVKYVLSKMNKRQR